jgi:hypothetical protein
MVDPSSSFTLWAWCFTGVLLQVDVGFSVYTMNGEVSLGGVMNGGQFWDGVLVRSKSRFYSTRYFHILLPIHCLFCLTQLETIILPVFQFFLLHPLCLLIFAFLCIKTARNLSVGETIDIMTSIGKCCLCVTDFLLAS